MFDTMNGASSSNEKRLNSPTCAQNFITKSRHDERKKKKHQTQCLSFQHRIVISTPREHRVAVMHRYVTISLIALQLEFRVDHFRDIIRIRDITKLALDVLVNNTRAFLDQINAYTTNEQ